MNHTKLSPLMKPVAALSLFAAGLPATSYAEQFVFDVAAADSSVDMTFFNFLEPISQFRTTADTATMPIGGRLTLDVQLNNDKTQVLSTDFVSLQLDYLPTLENPAVFFVTQTVDGTIDPIPAGSVLQVRLPFDESVAAGNPVPRFAPTLTLDGADAGTESGAGGQLQLTGSSFGFVGSGQYFDIPTPPGSPFKDGFPIDFGPFPTFTPFPDMIPVAFDVDTSVITFEPAPIGPNFLDGEVTILGNELVFEGDFLSFGVGGAGLLQPAQIHEGAFTAVAVIPEPASATALMTMMFVVGRRRRGL